MTLRQATALGIRLVGVALLLRIVVHLPAFVLAWIKITTTGMPGFEYMDATGISALLYANLGELLAGLALVIWAAPLSGWLLVDADPERRTPALDGVHFFRSLIAVAGLGITALAIGDLMGAVVEMRGDGGPEMYRTVYVDNAQARALTGIAKVIAGAVLVRQAHAIAQSVTSYWEGRDVEESTFD